ncbi:16733_t:CDS:1, partial [Dentiscutata heterogama]
MLLASIGSIQKSHPMEQWRNINGVAWLPLAPFRIILNGAMKQCQWSYSPFTSMDK